MLASTWLSRNPLEITLKRCDKIIDACKKNKVKLCTIMPSRFGGANMALKDAIASGRFGKTDARRYLRQMVSPRRSITIPAGGAGTWALDGGGAYMNQAIHNVDLLYWLMGDVAEVSGVTDTLAHKRIEVEDVGVATVRFKSGALGVLEATTACYPGLLKKTEIHGSEGTAIVEQDDIPRLGFCEEGSQRRFDQKEVLSQRSQHRGRRRSQGDFVPGASRSIEGLH